jgi:ABC-type dipeptide/oligopeptide/nickel transport system ATPase subunit
MEEIKIRGARTHNLKNINLDLPRNKLVVITGLSGSGKSSLAFDTLYAEGQRRYVESLSAYARQFLQLMEKPDVDLIEGLSPAISIEQKATSHNPRSTVGTVTEIHDYLRLLYARAGTPYCPDHGIALQAQSVSQMVDAALALPEDTKLMILAPVVSDRKGEHSDLFDTMQAQGFVRFRIRSGGGTAHEAEAKVYEVDALPKLKKTEKHTIEVVVDRVKVRADIKQRLAESFETALRLADGRAIALEMDTGREHVFSSRFACPICSYSLQELEPRLFSFNNPMGACPSCDGWARSRSSIRSAWWPFRTCRWPRARSRAGTAATSSTSRCCRAWRRSTNSTPKPRSRNCRRSAAGGAARLGRDRDPVHVYQRARPHHGARARVRRDHPEPGTPLPRNRFGGRARGTGQVPEQPGVPGLPRHAPAHRGAPREDRRGEQARAIYEINGCRCATR